MTRMWGLEAAAWLRGFAHHADIPEDAVDPLRQIADAIERKDAALREIEALRESAFSDTHSAFAKAKQVAHSALAPARETGETK